MEGKVALKNINYFVSNDLSDLAINDIRYGVLVYENGCAVDDVLIYHLSEEKYLWVVNASNIEKDYAFIKSHLFGEVKFENRSEDYGEIALQGPLSQEILTKLSNQIPTNYYSFIADVNIEGINCLISRTGYTGEDGFELYAHSSEIVKLWELVLKAGEDQGLEACGLGARDTLRLEAAMP